MAIKEATTALRRRAGLRRVAASAVMLALVLAQLPAPAGAGPFDPGLARRAERGLQEGPYGRAAVAAGISVTLPFQTVRSRSPLAETRLAAGLALRRTSRLATSAAAFEPVRVRPLARLSVDFTGRPDALRLNGLPLLAPAALAAEEDATEPPDALRLNGLPLLAPETHPVGDRMVNNDEDDHGNSNKKSKKALKWIGIGAGLYVVGSFVALIIVLS